MTIKQNGGIFGRNPTFNDVEADGTLTVTGQSTFNSNITVQNDVNPKISILDSNGGFNAASFLVENGGRDLAIFAQQDIIIDSNSGELARFLKDGGLTFNGDTANSNALDDYEEGEHTAVITATTSGTITLDSTNNKLAYTKVGRVVHVQGTIVVDSVSSPVGVAKITLPFTASNSLGGLAERSPPSIWIQGSVSKNTTDFIGYVAEGSNQISVGTGDSTNFLSLGANELQAASSIYISVTYTAS